MNNCSKETVNATVIRTEDNQAVLHIEASQQKSCKQCQSKGGCQSLSLYQLLYAKRPLSIDNDNYRLGEQLHITFPRNLIQRSIYWLLGLPLVGFITGIVAGISVNQIIFTNTHNTHNVGDNVGEIMGFCTGVVLAGAGVIAARRFTQKKIKKTLSITRCQ